MHRINATVGFSTSDRHVYKPQAIEIVANVEIITSQVHSIHFRNHSMAVDEEIAIKRVMEMRDELKQANERLYMFQFEKGGGISYLQAIILGDIITSVGTGIIFFIRHNIRQDRIRNERHHAETRRVVSETIS